MALPIMFKPEVKSKIKDKELAEKAKKEKKTKKLNGNNIIDLIELIKQDVEKHLGQYEQDYQLITTVEDFENYIQKANEYGKIAIDTETTGLNPLVDKIVGLCLYFPGEKAAYVPINHINYLNGERVPEQLTESQIKPILEKLTAKVIMHNAQFDIRVIKHNIGITLKCWWDTLISAILFDENELHGLKILHSKYISHTDEKSFSDYFKGMSFADIPIKYAYLYATHDAVDTFDLYEFYAKTLNDDEDNDPDDKALYWLFRNIEMPMVEVIVNLQDTGVAVDTEYLDKLKDKYHAMQQKALDECYKEIDKYQDQIKLYRAKNPVCKLDDPISIGSATQLAILFYDILKVKKLKAKKDRCTDVDFMNAYKDKYPIAKAILDYRAAQKITSTYVDNISDIIHTDGRVHTHFNSNGAKTGRMSSSDPLNLQNIPSHNEDIRKMFTGQTTYRDVNLRDDNAYIFDRCEEVELEDGTWQWVELLKAGDILSSGEVVKVVKVKDFKVLVGI